MTALAHALTDIAWNTLGGAKDAPQSISFASEGGLPSAFPVTDFGSAAVATAALALAELIASNGGVAPSVSVDRRLTSFWFWASIRPRDWKLPPTWDPIAGDYQTQDGWIRLHTNAPHHRAAAQSVLGGHSDKESVARAVAEWKSQDLESAIVAAGGCAAEMRTTEEWHRHPQGSAVADEPLVHMAWGDGPPSTNWRPTPSRPLHGLRVLDLTRVLAGPIASRFLAGFGAEVLRIDPPGWEEDTIAPEVTLGKTCARLDLRRTEDRATFETLLAGADIMLHGYRPEALERLGFGISRRREIAPSLIDVSLCAYGWSGPWASRRGFDSLMQMSTGIAATGMAWKKADKPFPLPVQAIDHATGYLMAATAIRGVTERFTNGRALQAKLSLARTAQFLFEQETGHDLPALAAETQEDKDPAIEATDWGEARRLKAPLHIQGAPMHWDYPARKLGSSEPRWR